MKILKLSLISTVLLFFACTHNAEKTSEASNLTLLSPDNVGLVCEEIPVENEEVTGPRHLVYFLAMEKEMKVAEIQSCETISADDYPAYQIPAEALAAVGGWYAGSGDYLYLIQEGENFVVKQAIVDEGVDKPGYEYKTVFSYGAKPAKK
jgi:hypothetical protein